MRRIAGLIGTASLALALALPAAALGADTYVDADTGSDTNPCTLASPCATIQEGIDEATATATVHVDPDSYPLGLQIGDGKSLIAEEFVGGPEGSATINGGGFIALDVLATGAGTVSGFDITSTTSPVIDVAGPINLTGNSILVPSTNADGIDVTAGTAGLVTIDDNDFFGDSTSGQLAIKVVNGSEVSITGNRIGSPGNAFNSGIMVREGTTAQIADNVLRSFFQSASIAGQPIFVQDASATITGNLVTDTQPSPDFVYGIVLQEGAGPPDTEVTLTRNQLYGGGNGEGVNILDVTSVSMDGDLVTGFTTGIVPRWFGSLPRPVLQVTGATVYGNGTRDIQLEAFDLTLDSSIVGLPIALSGPALVCAISFSRGPTADDSNSCTDFQTTASPEFVDESPTFGEPDLHLTPGSPMLDAGNPAAPAPGATDFDGDPRALDGDGECPEQVRRDIGADELGARLDCDPPQTRIRGPRRTSLERVRFRLSSDEAGSTFRCKLDGGRYRRCGKRYRTPRLDPGQHTLRAKATDPAGNGDPTPARKRFVIVGG